MVLLGIVGAQSPMGKLVHELLQQHTENYKVIFTVDCRHKRSRGKSEYNDLEDALLSQTPTAVLDFGEPKTAFERTKIYRYYFVPAVMYAPAFTDDQLSQLKAVRSGSQRSVPFLIIENELSLSHILLREQLMQTLRVFASQVMFVKIYLKDTTDNYLERYRPLLEQINRRLGTKEKTIKLIKRPDNLTEYGRTYVYVLSLSDDQTFAQEKIKVEVCLDRGLDVVPLTYQFPNHRMTVWQGLDRLMTHLITRLSIVNGELEVDVLAQIVRQSY